MALDRISRIDPSLAERARRAWDATEAEREAKRAMIAAGRPLDAESEQRLEKYAARLEKNVGNISPKAQAEMAERLGAARREGRSAAARERRARTFERVIGEAEEFISVMFISRAAHVLRSVGRVVDWRQQYGFGTGFLVAPGVLMTNHHVLRNAADAAVSAVQFRYELDMGMSELSPVEFRLEPERLFVTDPDPDLDFALVAVAARGADGAAIEDFGHLPLVGAEGKIRLGQPVNIVQHPEGERKQVVFRESTLSLLPESLRTLAQYTGDTKPGSSGSPVFSDAWEVVALHHSGVPATDAAGDWLDLDDQKWDENADPEMRRVKWVANEGIRVSSLVAKIRAMHAEPATIGRDLLARVIAVGDAADRDGVFPRIPAVALQEAPRRPLGLAPGSEAATPAVARMSVEVPLTITVSLGTAGVTGLALSAAVTERGRNVESYRDRKGFDRAFVGAPVEMPVPLNTIAGNVASLPGTEETELRYDHFSVLMNRSRRLAYVSAGNLWFDAPFKATRRDPWGYDPRLPEALQAGNEFYSLNDLDRGHLFRRADGAWGETEAEAERANDDTCHWTNIAPQHAVFNQSGQDPELSLWGLLENHVAEEAERLGRRINVFNGPIFLDDDPLHRGLQVPRSFFKVLSLVEDDEKLRAYAFVVGQEELLQTLPTEALRPGRFAIFQVKLRDLEGRTALDFGVLRAADVLEALGSEERFARGSSAVRIGRLADVVRGR